MCARVGLERSILTSLGQTICQKLLVPACKAVLLTCVGMEGVRNLPRKLASFACFCIFVVMCRMEKHLSQNPQRSAPFRISDEQHEKHAENLSQTVPTSVRTDRKLVQFTWSSEQIRSSVPPIQSSVAFVFALVRDHSTRCSRYSKE